MTDKDHHHPDEDDQVEENDQQDGDQERTEEHSRVLVETAAGNVRILSKGLHNLSK